MDQEPKFVQYNRGNIDYARDNRKNPTKAEWLVWNLILKNRPLGFKFTRQKLLGSFIVDFYCSKLMLVIEIDGDSHDNKVEYDTQRDSYLNDLGMRIIKYSNDDILNNFDSAKEDIIQSIILNAVAGKEVESLKVT